MSCLAITNKWKWKIIPSNYVQSSLSFYIDHMIQKHCKSVPCMACRFINAFLGWLLVHQFLNQMIIKRAIIRDEFRGARGLSPCWTRVILWNSIKISLDFTYYLVKLISFHPLILVILPFYCILPHLDEFSRFVIGYYRLSRDRFRLWQSSSSSMRLPIRVPRKLRGIFGSRPTNPMCTRLQEL